MRGDRCGLAAIDLLLDRGLPRLSSPASPGTGMSFHLPNRVARGIADTDERLCREPAIEIDSWHNNPPSPGASAGVRGPSRAPQPVPEVSSPPTTGLPLLLVQSSASQRYYMIHRVAV